MATDVVTLGLSAPTRRNRKKRLPLLDAALEAQRSLTAVERFSEQHSQGGLDATKPYESLLPATPPAAGQQYAFRVDLDACTGCKACVVGCNNKNGLDSGETWRSVGALHGGDAQAPVQKTVTSACHHCVDPACMKGCPVAAYEKDPDTGIVKHLDDQCIGCQYCVLTCPYEVPQYNARLGIVRKCDMCAGRLAEGEAPACVQSCPNGAIAIDVIDVKAAIADAQADTFLPGAPSPGITLPTTVYRTTEALPRNTLPVDFYAVRPASQHVPLVVMLVLTQLSVGAFAADQVLAGFLPDSAHALVRPTQAMVAWATALVALGASTLHLGRPQYAFRALLGLRTSWVSREIAVFGLFSVLASAYALQVSGLLGAYAPALSDRMAPYADTMGQAVIVSGIAGVLSSAMLYHVTRRAWWHLGRTAPTFLGSTAVLGTATAIAAVCIGAHGVGSDGGAIGVSISQALFTAAWALMAATIGKLCIEGSLLFHLGSRQQTDLKRSAVLVTGALRDRTQLRFLMAIIGGLVLPFVCIVHADDPTSTWSLVGASLSLCMLLVGEVLERMTFFNACAGPRMPGGLH